MKINISIEATPEEVREALALPNVSGVQSECLRQMKKKMQDGSLDAQAMTDVLEPTLRFGQQFVEALAQSMDTAMKPPKAKDK